MSTHVTKAVILVGRGVNATIRFVVTVGAGLLSTPAATWAQHTPVTPRIPVATRDIVRGATLTSADITWIPDTVGVTGTATSTRDTMRVSTGWIARRMIRAGEPLRAPSVSRPDVVTTGDHVDMEYRADGVTLKLKGIAVGGGAVGDRIYVRLDDRRRLPGIVIGPNSVQVTP